MKAWTAWNKYDALGSIIVFAETRSKARYIASKSEYMEDVSFFNIEVRRNAKADAIYKGCPELDFDDPEQRRFVVKELGWRCSEYDPSICAECSASEFFEFKEDSENY